MIDTSLQIWEVARTPAIGFNANCGATEGPEQAAGLSARDVQIRQAVASFVYSSNLVATQRGGSSSSI